MCEFLKKLFAQASATELEGGGPFELHCRLYLLELRIGRIWVGLLAFNPIQMLNLIQKIQPKIQYNKLGWVLGRIFWDWDVFFGLYFLDRSIIWAKLVGLD